jgi:lipopolysaccharide export system protein LptA
MLSGDDPVQARAESMASTDENQRIRYEGSALLWQGANRLQADQITIDRRSGSIIAEGNVVSQLAEKPDPKKPDTKKSNPIFTVVKSQAMTYSDKERVAHYTGGANLIRGTTVVDAKQIKAFLKPAGGDAAGSELDRAIADGDVKIRQTTPQRKRTGTSEHAEYHAAEGRILLTGGRPELVDSVKGTTRGPRLTYFANNDRLLVEGAPGQPVESRLRRN